MTKDELTQTPTSSAIEKLPQESISEPSSKVSPASKDSISPTSTKSEINARRIKLLQIALIVIGYLWILALPYEGLWKTTYIDEHALQPAQVTMYWDWGEVHKADKYLEKLEGLVNSTFEERSKYLVKAFLEAGLSAGNTSNAVYASVTPPRSSGTETILISANWISRDGGLNLRGIATLLAMGDFLRGQNHWAFNIILISGDSYLTGLSSFLSTYHTLFSGSIWTGLNIDYPGHSFSHLGIFYEGLNGRLPNQDIPNTIAHVGRWAGGVDIRLHDIPSEAPTSVEEYLGWMRRFGKIGEEVIGVVGKYVVGLRHLWSHGKYMVLGRASGGHGVMAKYRIDSSTLYCTPSTGPHGFHTLGRTLESTLRSLNNMLERLHASYFFYLLPSPGHFIPVGNYLPSAILLGSSVVIGGLSCPQPPHLAGIGYILLSILIGGIGMYVQSPLVTLLAIFIPRPEGKIRETIISLSHLGYGAMIPTLAMLNFPQSLLLATVTIAYLSPWRTGKWVALILLHPVWAQFGVKGLEEEWRVLGNMFWPGVFMVWVPLWVIAFIT